MSRIRSFKPEWMDEERRAELSHEAFRLWVGMVALADDYGNLPGNPLRLHSSIFWARSLVNPRESLANFLEELARAELITLYQVDGQQYAHLSTWSIDQRIDHRGRPQVPGPEQVAPQQSLPFASIPREGHARITRESAGSSRDPRETLAPDLDLDPERDLDRDPEGDPDFRLAPAGAAAPSTTAPASDEDLASGSSTRGEPGKTTQGTRPGQGTRPCCQEVDGDRMRIIEARFCARFREALGVPYVHAYGRDRKALKGLPGEYTTERLTGLLDVFFRQRDPFIFDTRGASIAVFVEKLPALVSSTSCPPAQLGEGGMRRRRDEGLSAAELAEMAVDLERQGR